MESGRGTCAKCGQRPFTYANTVFASIESEKHEVLFSSERSLRQEPFRSLVTALFGDGVRQDIALTIERIGQERLSGI